MKVGDNIYALEFKSYEQLMTNQKLQMKQKAFTLNELLIVIVIILVLGGFLLPSLSRARQNAKIRVAEAEINQLVVAIQMYAEDYGRYPDGRGDTNDGTDCGDLIDALEDSVGNGPYSTWPADKKSGTNLLDPWENSYRYDIVTIVGTGMGYNIWSDGPDGENNSGEDDDIKNW